MRTLASCILALILTALPARAQESDSLAVDLAGQLLEAMGQHKNLAVLTDEMLLPILKAMQAPDRPMDPLLEQVVRETMREVMSLHEEDFHAMQREQAKRMAMAFSADDLRELIAFYHSELSLRLQRYQLDSMADQAGATGTFYPGWQEDFERLMPQHLQEAGLEH